ncbi:5-methyltetrahydropteroyltriglutamate--homocysteine methyltransferase [Geomonas sp. Red276]
MLTHNLGYPRIGADRELKTACERFWSNEIDLQELEETGKKLRKVHWEAQREAGLDLIPCNDFSFYDQTLDLSLTVGAVPPRFSRLSQAPLPELAFAMARGCQKEGVDVVAMEMTKWFDTNYHYLVPEFTRDQRFSLTPGKPLAELKEARGMGFAAKPVLIGPVSYLLLGKEKETGFHRIDLLKRLLPVYRELLTELRRGGAEWVQLDEPFLALDLSPEVAAAYREAYARLAAGGALPKLLVATYFAGLGENAELAARLPVTALHLDLVRAPAQLEEILPLVPHELTLSLGVVDGRNIWKNDFARSLPLVQRAVEALGEERVMVAPSCSLLHVPYDCAPEREAGVLPPEVVDWISFARQKLDEVTTIASLALKGAAALEDPRVTANAEAQERRRHSPLIHRPEVKERVKGITPEKLRRATPFATRRARQQEALALPSFPTTTIGSFPQTAEVRRLRSRLSSGKLSAEEYRAQIEREIERTVRFQEEVGLDVLVHGEYERNDMVQYFGEQLEGCGFTRGGWVQSFGSRCVRPPVIFGDVERRGPMTVSWTVFAQSLTERPVKGMLTGPVTILQWSFVRDDQPRSDTARQLALAIRDEAVELERGGIRVIQIDEPAFREGVPLKLADRGAYFAWAADCFRLATSGVEDATQIHTHMCYSEFNDIIDRIAALDADVITIEASRSQMELLEAFKEFSYPNDIGPGVWDIHSPRIPSCEEMFDLLERALECVPKERLWVNPDCGLKTRGWNETRAALANMVFAARALRERYFAPPAR